MLRKQNKKNFDNCHKARELQPLRPGDTVWIPENKSNGTVVEQSNTRSYTVRVQDGTIRRNRRDLIAMPDPQESESTDEQSTVRDGREPMQNQRSPDTALTENGTRKNKKRQIV